VGTLLYNIMLLTLQLTDTMMSYNLNFHPMPHGITVYCECYTMGFPVCYRSQKHYECKECDRSGRWWHVTLHVQTCSGHNCIIPMMRQTNTDSIPNMSGFGILVVSMLPSGTQDASLLPAEAVGFFRRKNPQHAFLQKRGRAVCPMSQICGMLKNPIIYRGSHKL
jgi:hypothetical protein